MLSSDYSLSSISLIMSRASFVAANASLRSAFPRSLGDDVSMLPVTFPFRMIKTRRFKILAPKPFLALMLTATIVASSSKSLIGSTVVQSSNVAESGSCACFLNHSITSGTATGVLFGGGGGGVEPEFSFWAIAGARFCRSARPSQKAPPIETNAITKSKIPAMLPGDSFLRYGDSFPGASTKVLFASRNAGGSSFCSNEGPSTVGTTILFLHFGHFVSRPEYEGAAFNCFPQKKHCHRIKSGVEIGRAHV